MVFGPDNPPYEPIGGIEGVTALVDSFYSYMDSEAKFEGIRTMHPSDLKETREKLTEFLSGWLGGPDLYIRKHGHPRLRMRHAPFKIGIHERDQWLGCMAMAMDQQGIKGELREFLDARFAHVADFMKNVPG